MTVFAGTKVRREPRRSALALAARYRSVGAESWRDGELLDLSVGGALLRCEDVRVGQRVELRLARAHDGVDVELAAEVIRIIARGDRPAAAVRFRELTRDATNTIAGILNKALESEESAEQVDPGQVPALSSLRLHDISLYDLLELNPACDDGELEGRCEALIADVAQQASEAVGRREERLRVMHASLERMRPLWGDPVKRARYDLRWGYVRAEERLRDAARGAGVHAHALAGIWFDLYPESVREAERIMARADDDGLVAALREAIELDPFCRRRRQRLAAIESPRAPNAEAPTAPAPSEAPCMRGSLADLPLRRLLRSIAEDEDDVEIVVRVGGKAIGVVGFTGGDVVTAICGDHRGLAALRALTAVPEGTFQARYAEPRPHLRHMREPALPLLEQLAR